MRDRFSLPAADGLTRAVNRARPDAGREVCTTPENRNPETTTTCQEPLFW